MGDHDASGTDSGGLSRRQVLRIGALGAAAAGAARVFPGIATLGGVAPAFAAEALTENSFRVDIDGLPDAGCNVTSIAIEALTIDVRETTTRQDREWRTFAPGAPHFGDVTIRFAVGTRPNGLREWFNDAAAGLDVRKNISVVIMDAGGSPARTWQLQQCFPVKWDSGDYSPSSQVQTETVVVKTGFVELG